MNPESEDSQQDSTKKQQDKNKKMFLLLTKRKQVHKLEDEIDDLVMEILLYGEKE